jgi:hypothetical protein
MTFPKVLVKNFFLLADNWDIFPSRNLDINIYLLQIICEENTQNIIVI